ncbi:MAG: paraquat-inducible protein A [Gammaproteobacteria bacterium]|nr:paraquat-inducible protein A [Gammaproteobacteria bacterium]NNJ71906.1 paraquat-inducible protein A [Enterobacterales bacterium]
MEATALDNLTACRECDLLVERIPLELEQHAHCPRCNALLYAGRKNPVNKTLLVSMSGLLMVYPAYFLPLMEMGTLGLYSSTSIIETVTPMMTGVYWLPAISLFLFAILFPALLLILAFWISLHIRIGRFPRYLSVMQRFFQALVSWGMPEVYVLGIIVSLVKLLDDFAVVVGPGLFSFVVMMFCSLLVTTTVSRLYFWEAIEHGRTE